MLGAATFAFGMLMALYGVFEMTAAMSEMRAQRKKGRNR